MAEMFSTLGTWNWLIFGIILMALELVAPGVFLFWLGLAALLVGLLSFVVHPSWQVQILLLAGFAAPLFGRWFRLENPIIDGSGTVRIDDTVWRVPGPDAPAGTRVRIVQADGA